MFYVQELSHINKKFLREKKMTSEMKHHSSWMPFDGGSMFFIRIDELTYNSKLFDYEIIRTYAWKFQCVFFI